MKQLAAMATRLAIILGATVVLASGVSADPRAPSIAAPSVAGLAGAALPGATPDHRLASPASTSTGEPAGLTRAEALQRLRVEGFTTVTRLVRDSEGNWLGAAQRGSRIVDIAVDQDGDVIAW